MKLRGIAILLMVTISIAVAVAQAPGSGKRGHNYDPKTETTIKGTVDDVQQLPGKGAATGTHLMLKTESGTVDVHVGPTSYLAKQQFSFAKGDQIEVTGSKIGTDTIIAREIKKDGKALTLRDTQGIPAWSRGGGSPN